MSELEELLAAIDNCDPDRHSPLGLEAMVAVKDLAERLRESESARDAERKDHLMTLQESSTRRNQAEQLKLVLKNVIAERDALRKEKQQMDWLEEIGIKASYTELLKDRARLDWLEKVGFSTTNRGDIEREPGVHSWGPPGVGCFGWTARWISSEFKSARSAIDAAMPMAPGPIGGGE